METRFEFALVVPVYNEEAIIGDSLRSKIALLEQLYVTKQLIIVDDCSTDNSFQIITNLFKDYSGPLNLICVRNNQNEGFGGAVWKGIQHAKAKYILCLPVDLTITSDELNEIYALLLQNKVVACYRTVRPGNSKISILGSEIYQGLIRLIFGLETKDVNWVHAYPAEIFKSGGIELKNKRIFFLAEALIKCHWLGYEIAELPLNPQLRTNRKGHSQSFSTFFAAILDTLRFMFASIVKGKRGDI
jgi:glycosyltransferase involved in cell wall biosynthesis